MREVLDFDCGWLFHKGDIDCSLPNRKGPVYTSAKTERMHVGPASRFYGSEEVDDFNREHEFCREEWEYVNLPHDYMITETPSEHENPARGFFPCKNAWYRKYFTLSSDDKDKRITLLFEGVATHATVYLNGCLIKRNFCGYTEFEVDITDYVKFDEKNLLAVYVQTTGQEGWWYEGGGIYRHVKLIKTSPVCIDLWGVYVAPRLTNGNGWEVGVQTTVLNSTYEQTCISAQTCFYDRDGNLIATAVGVGTVAAREKATLAYCATVQNPSLWDISNPYLYTVKTTLSIDGQEVDCDVTRTGFRTLVAHPQKGLFLNGKPVRINGVCAHQDFGLTGKAVADNIQRYKIQLIKEMGANGYRTSHYPHSSSTMDALDETGFLVMNETRWFDSSDEGIAQLSMLVKRDRNRPSVCFWSIGNEEPHHVTEEGRRICAAMAAEVRKLDDTRMVMTAVNEDPVNGTVYGSLDVIGVNYNLQHLDAIHEKFAHLPVMLSECCASSTTRGWYQDAFPPKQFLPAYDDTNPDKFFLGREITQKAIEARSWILGSYQWIAIEHRGEAIWPRLCSQAGAIDLYLQKKDAFYQNQSFWIEDKPVLHLLPHWNFEGREGEAIRVSAYTNLPQVELFLNGKSVGVREVKRYGHAEWSVCYEAGELCVKGMDENGKIVAEDVRQTTGAPVSLKLRLENQVEHANGKDVALVTCYCVDSEGREVPTANPFVEFSCNALGKIVGTGSDITDHVPPIVPSRKMRAGRISVAVQVGAARGELRLYAEAQGLKTASCTVKLN